MKKLMELTKPQRMLMETVRDEYLDLFFSLRFDEEKSKQLVDFIYTLAGLKTPIKIVLDSPLALQFAANILTSVSQVWDQVGSQVGDQVRSQVGSQVRSQVWDQVRSQVWSQVRSQVGDQVRSQVWDQVRSQVGDQVRSQVGDQVWAKCNLQYYLGAWRGTCWDFNWVAFYDFFERLQIVNFSKFTDYKNLIRSNPFTMLQFEKVCLICRSPHWIRRDERNSLHCTTDYAVRFHDGYGQHYIWGVYFSPEDFQRYVKHHVSAQELFQIENQEQKAAIIKLYGYESLLEELPECRMVDKYEKQGKQHVLYQWRMTSEVQPRFLMVEDFSTTRRYFLGVPPTCRTALEALAWTFNVPTQDYAKLKQET